MKISLELFPPKNDEATKALNAALPKLAALNPEFFTVTYGAGGSTKDGTLKTAALVQEKTGIASATHLTYMTTPRVDLMDYAKDLLKHDIKSIVALRGDLPKGKTFKDFAGSEYFESTPQFISALKGLYDFDISVAAYPNTHPDAPSPEADIQTLKDKCDAGGARALTQFFFENQPFIDFSAKCKAAGINAPIVAGLLPIYDFDAMANFANKCGAVLPDDLRARWEKQGAPALLAEQIADLREKGEDHIHFYTLNRADVIQEALEKMRKI